MRLFKRLGCAVLAVFLLLGAALLFTAMPPYERPAVAAATTPKEFVPTVPRRAGDRTVILFVFDGFAASTVRAAQAPNFARMAREGAHALDMMPVFPSLSMPNHFSLATGCYPAQHGVVSNHFRDPDRGIYTSPGDADWLLACEPLPIVLVSPSRRPECPADRPRARLLAPVPRAWAPPAPGGGCRSG